MQFYGKAREAAAEILQAFKNPGSLPQPLANLFIRRRDDVPCRSWSWRNQLLVALHGYTDARGYRQWQQVGRHVKQGERAFHILAPLTKKWRDEKTCEEKVVVTGFRSVPVFGLEQTEGRSLPVADPEADGWLETLPLIEVARRWKLKVQAVDGDSVPFLGSFRRGKGILLGVRNLATWTHELLHAADHRLGNLQESGQHWRSETVAELGGAVLLCLLGRPEDADLGGCMRYVQKYAGAAGIEATEAGWRVVDRTCQAVALVLDTAQEIMQETMPLFAGTAP